MKEIRSLVTMRSAWLIPAAVLGSLWICIGTSRGRRPSRCSCWYCTVFDSDVPVLTCAGKGEFLADQREGCALHSSGLLQNHCAPAALKAKAGGPAAITVLHCIDIGLMQSSCEHVQVKEICSLVSVRSARLIAAAICGIIVHLQRDKPKQEGQPPPRNCVAVDGGVLVRYKFYRELLVQGVRDALGDAVADQVKFRPDFHCSLCAVFSVLWRSILSVCLLRFLHFIEVGTIFG